MDCGLTEYLLTKMGTGKQWQDAAVGEGAIAWVLEVMVARNRRF
jgi:hypothetical protein